MISENAAPVNTSMIVICLNHPTKGRCSRLLIHSGFFFASWAVTSRAWAISIAMSACPLPAECGNLRHSKSVYHQACDPVYHGTYSTLRASNVPQWEIDNCFTWLSFQGVVVRSLMVGDCSAFHLVNELSIRTSVIFLGVMSLWTNTYVCACLGEWSSFYWWWPQSNVEDV